MKNNVVIGTFLPFHLGHAELIDFAAAYDPTATLHVIVSTRDNEPILGRNRFYAIKEHFASNESIKVHWHNDNKAPQSPTSNDDLGFWNYWNDTISSFVKVPIDTVFASEHYGKKLAASLGASFVPYDVDRITTSISGTDIRKNIVRNWDFLTSEMKTKLVTRVVVIGPESIGKTTISKELSMNNDWVFVPEWARGYLETVGAELSYSKMHTIFKGQLALENITSKYANAPVIVHDTDLIATWAYHYISGILPMSAEFRDMMVLTTHTRPTYRFGDLYLLLSDEIPFEADPLRYGGDKRESSSEYWEKLLLHFGVNYVKIPKGTIEETELLCRYEINKFLNKKFQTLREFNRE